MCTSDLTNTDEIGSEKCCLPLTPPPQQTQIQTDLHVTTEHLHVHVMAHTAGLLTPCSPSTCLSTSGVLSYFMSQLSFPRSGVEKKFFHSTLCNNRRDYSHKYRPGILSQKHVKCSHWLLWGHMTF